MIKSLFFCHFFVKLVTFITLLCYNKLYMMIEGVIIMMLTTFSEKVIDISNLEQSNGIININNFLYHVQYYQQEAMILNELTGNYLAKYFNLPVPDLAIFKDSNKYG